MTTYFPPKKNIAYVAYISLISQANTKIMQANPTIASGDFKVSIDGGALANLTTLPSVAPASSKMVLISLSSSEMNGDNITIVCSDAAGAEWCDLVLNLQTTARQIDDLAYPATSGRSMVVDASGLVDANTVKIGPTGSGTAQTARDVGASVLLSSGTGTGQLDFTSGVTKANATQILGTAVSSPATAGILDVNVKNMNNVAATSVTTINANVGTTQPTNFTGTSTSALVKSDMVDVAGAAVSTSTAQIGVNAVNWAGGAIPAPAVTGVPKIDLAYILGTILTETSGQIAAAFKKFFDKATPTGTVNSLPDAVAGATGGLFIAGTNAATTVTTALTTTFTGNLTGSAGSVTGAVGSVTGAVGSVTGNVGGNVTGSVGSIASGGIAAASFAAGAIDAAAIATDAIGSAELAASAIIEIQSGLSTYAGGDTSGVTTLLSRLTSTRAALLDFLTGDAFSRLGAPVGASISADIAAVQADTDDVQTRIPAALVSGRMDSSVGAMAAGTVTAAAVATNAIDADALATDAVNEIADGLLNRDMSTGTDSGSTTVRTMRQALRKLRNKWTLVGTTWTTYKEDDSTVSFSETVTTNASADPVTATDPA